MIMIIIIIIIKPTTEQMPRINKGLEYPEIKYYF